MKRILTLCLAALALVETGAAQEKIQERSAPKAPKWIGTSASEYIIVSAEEPTLDAARDRCLKDIQQAIVNTVSVNICSDEQLFEQQHERDGASTFSRDYESQIRTQAGRLPFITNITLSDAEIYWERRLVKKEKRTYYICHAKYPFPLTRRNELIAEFMRQDREQYAKYLALKEELDTFTRIEDIGRAITDLGQLYDYFFDGRRRGEVEALQRKYRSAYGEIAAIPYSNELGEHYFYLTIAGRRVTTSRAPVIKSQYATDIVVTPVGESLYRVTYNHEQCLDEDDNRIELIYMLGAQAVRHGFSFDVREGKVTVIPQGEIELDLRPAADSLAAGNSPRITGWINLRTKYDTPFEVTALNLTAEGIEARIETALSSRFEGKGTHRLAFVVEGDFPTTPRRAALARGVLTVRNLQSGKSEEIRIALPYKIRKQ